jgi:hypothetical protein
MSKDNRLMVRVDDAFLQRIDEYRQKMSAEFGVQMSQAEALRSLAVIGLNHQPDAR